MNTLLAFGEGLFAPSHIIIMLIVGVLLFGKRLPEIGRSLGKGLVEFKKGMQGVEDDLQAPTNTQQAAAPEAIRPPQRVTTSVPKFESAPPANATQNPQQPQV
jgi:sec-independent protein translocase protein TatA